jgi:hypothetical protein
VFLFTGDSSSRHFCPLNKVFSEKCRQSQVPRGGGAIAMLSGLFLMDMQKSRPCFFYLSALEGAVAIAALLSIPSEGGSLSPARLALVGFILVLCFGWIYLGLRRKEILPGMGRSLYLYLCVLACLVLALLLFFLRYYNPALPFYL